jgi:hypothetical protein
MNASISEVCYKPKTIANGENPLTLQVPKDGKRKHQSLGLSVNQTFQDYQNNHSDYENRTKMQAKKETYTEYCKLPCAKSAGI